MDKSDHLFGPEMEDAKENLTFKTNSLDLLLDLKVLMKEYYMATFEQDGKYLKLSFQNGQRFRVSVEEIS
ncbi:MAG: hypothetical protein HFK02_02840 [Clostridia bacterium]|jgi:hypothetical protein|nr:hypothetical protein [Clostridia bacterium]